MDWYRETLDILRQEPEQWLAYLHGQQLKNDPYLVKKLPRYRGLLISLCSFLRSIVRSAGLRTRPVSSEQRVDYLAYADTTNQFASLDTTLGSLKKNGAHVVAIARPRIVNPRVLQAGFQRYSIGPVDIAKIIVLFVTRAPKLYRELKRWDKRAANWYFYVFCEVYIFIVYFHRVISFLKPGYVITSNDHNEANRCLLAVAHYFGVKTVYLQHASITDAFPALRVNYAFLDGQCALDTYLQCEANQPPWTRQVPTPEVFLTGQKKKLSVKHRDSKWVGVAINPMDDIQQVVALVNELAAVGFRTSLRWHPGQTSIHVDQVKNAFVDSEAVYLSNPQAESVDQYLSALGCLVAGNSSIHLEAALMGVQPIYFEMGASEEKDYYQYVKNGVSTSASSLNELITLIERIQIEKLQPGVSAVRYYSSTYHTEWDGREGELVANILMERAGRGLSDQSRWRRPFLGNDTHGVHWNEAAGVECP